MSVVLFRSQRCAFPGLDPAPAWAAPYPAPQIRASFSPGGDYITCGSDDGWVYVWGTRKSDVPPSGGASAFQREPENPLAKVRRRRRRPPRPARALLSCRLGSLPGLPTSLAAPGTVPSSTLRGLPGLPVAAGPRAQLHGPALRVSSPFAFLQCLRSRCRPTQRPSAACPAPPRPLGRKRTPRTSASRPTGTSSRWPFSPLPRATALVRSAGPGLGPGQAVSADAGIGRRQPD